MKKALLEFFRKGSIVIGATKNGTYYNLRFDTAHIYEVGGKQYVEVEKSTRLYKGGKQGRQISTMTREVSKVNGEWVLGRMVIDKYHRVITRRYWYETNVTNRLDSGFETLMGHFRADGISKEVVDALRDKWVTLSDTEKSKVWNYYRQDTVDANFGSSSLSSRGAGMSLDAMDYVDSMNKAIDKVIIDAI